MLDQKNIQIDTRSVIRDVAMRIVNEPYINDMTTIGRFVDRESQNMALIVARLWLAQISHNKAMTIEQVKADISGLVDGGFCQVNATLNPQQLNSLKETIFQAMLGSYYNRVTPMMSGWWDSCLLKQINMETYVIQCTRRSQSPFVAGTQPVLHNAFALSGERSLFG